MRVIPHVIDLYERALWILF